MKRRKAGKKHRLLLYKRALDRVWKITLPVGLLLLGLWFFSSVFIPTLHAPYDALAFVVALLLIVFSIFILLVRNLTYVQVFPNYIRLVTPFLRLNISFKRVRAVRSAAVTQLFPPKETKGSQRSLIEPYYGDTAVVLLLNSYPLSPRLLRRMLPLYLFPKKPPAFIFVIQDWMALSTELDSFHGSFGQSKNRQKSTRYDYLYSTNKR
jgi:hypothetical protein